MTTSPLRRSRAGLAVGGSMLIVGLVAGGATALGLRAHPSGQTATSVPWQTSTSEQWRQTWPQPEQLPQALPRAAGPAADPATSTATASESAGLVEIASTLTDGRAAGTGMVLTADGTVVTNHHVVAGATAIRVTVPGTGTAAGRTYTATYVGGDATRDVAVLKLTGARGLTTVHLASGGVAVGDRVTAVGDANGDGGSLTAAPGTVTAEDQTITVEGDGGTPARLSGLLALTSDLVPGDSGGAVLDADGSVVAMNVAASTGTADVTGYAIPLAQVQDVVRAVLAGDDTGTVDLGYHGYLGVALGSSAPVVEQTVAGGPAARAGIAAGDTLTAIGGSKVASTGAVRARVAGLDPGDRVRVTWTGTDGSTHSATVTLGKAPVA